MPKKKKEEPKETETEKEEMIESANEANVKVSKGDNQESKDEGDTTSVDLSDSEDTTMTTHCRKTPFGIEVWDPVEKRTVLKDG